MEPNRPLPDSPAADPVAFAQAHGAAYVAEAADLRGIRIPPGAGPHEVDELLNGQIRPRLDRLEFLRGMALALRSNMKIGARVAKAAMEDAWDAAWQDMSRTGGRAGSDFDNARERSARLNLKVIGETRTFRQWEIAADIAEDTHERVRQMHEGVKDVRQDALQHLRHVVWESTLER